MIAVQLRTSNGYLLIASIYIPPTVQLINEVFEELYQINNDCLILGDLNASLQVIGSNRTNSKGRQLEKLLDERYLRCVDSTLTTYTRHNYEEKLDLILASHPTILSINDLSTQYLLGTKEDHKPLTFSLNFNADPKPLSPRLSLNFKLTNWQLDRKYLNNLLSKIDQTTTTIQQIESFTTMVTNCIVSAGKLVIPVVNQTMKNFEISKKTKALIENKHRAY
ncbi:unnamed protein product [Rotaria magnacalcarata]|uniref:Endonuclease/exonuclease/phosphatase domain-containing protein n=2 Tax=Rotaria magnacalcarata TaxID=392030 RepID=A0A816UN96_9BILA|nr:unnamed protein product [Rotaria magnacalcarata]CAF2110378.1 unnamed protein product [Rotaria magnacalcarata]CAF3921360.1 unnamed protein product [Rotaria magnacalcarata]